MAKIELSKSVLKQLCDLPQKHDLRSFRQAGIIINRMIADNWGRKIPEEIEAATKGRVNEYHIRFARTLAEWSKGECAIAEKKNLSERDIRLLSGLGRKPGRSTKSRTAKLIALRSKLLNTHPGISDTKKLKAWRAKVNRERLQLQPNLDEHGRRKLLMDAAKGVELQLNQTKVRVEQASEIASGNHKVALRNLADQIERVRRKAQERFKEAIEFIR